MKIIAILFMAATAVVSGYTAEDAFHAAEEAQAHREAVQQSSSRLEIPTGTAPLSTWWSRYVSLLPGPTLNILTMRSPFPKAQIDDWLLTAATPPNGEGRLSNWRDYVAVRVLIEKPRPNLMPVVGKVMYGLSQKFAPSAVMNKATIDVAITEVIGGVNMEAHRSALRGGYDANDAPYHAAYMAASHHAMAQQPFQAVKGDPVAEYLARLAEAKKLLEERSGGKRKPTTLSPSNVFANRNPTAAPTRKPTSAPLFTPPPFPSGDVSAQFVPPPPPDSLAIFVPPSKTGPASAWEQYATMRSFRHNPTFNQKLVMPTIMEKLTALGNNISRAQVDQIVDAMWKN